MSNVIPSIYAQGSYTAKEPFENIVDPEVYYVAESIRTVAEMRSMNLNLHKLIFEPVGIDLGTGLSYLDECEKMNGAVIKLTSSGNIPIYILSNRLASFPVVDGVKYERMALIVDLGAVPPGMKTVLEEAKVDIKDYVLSKVGVDNEVKVGVCPTKGYVSGDQAEIFENTRLNKIKNSQSNTQLISSLQEESVKKDAYIQALEAKVIELSS